MKRIFFIMLAILVLASCTQPEDSEVVARVGEKEITVGTLESELNRELLGFPEEFREKKKSVAKLRRRTLDEMIDRMLLLQAALNAGTNVAEPELQNEIRRHKNQYSEWNFQKILKERGLTTEDWILRKKNNLIIKKYLDHKVSVENPVTPEVIQAHYEGHVEDYLQPESVRVRQIVTDSKEKAESILRRLRNGENFAKLATDLSMSPDKKQGGDLGFIVRGSFPREFEVCFSMNPGEVSPIIPSAYGFHLFKVIEKRPERKLPLKEVEDKIAFELKLEFRESGRKALLESLKNKYPVTYEENTLKRLN